MSRTLFVTTALPYANGSFHIGHIMEYIQADIWVRSMRMAGHTVHFVGADDTHGAPIMLKAESEGITPQELVARYGRERPQYLNGFHIKFDHWHSTDSPENVELSQDIYRQLRAAKSRRRVLTMRARSKTVSRLGSTRPSPRVLLASLVWGEQARGSET